MELLETVDKVTQLSRILLWRYISVLLFFALHKHKMLMFLWTKCYESRLHCLTIFHRLHFRSHSEWLHQWVLLSNHCIFFVVQCLCVNTFLHVQCTTTMLWVFIHFIFNWFFLSQWKQFQPVNWLVFYWSTVLSATETIHDISAIGNRNNHINPSQERTR